MTTSVPSVLQLATAPSLATELLRAAVDRRPARPGEVPSLAVYVPRLSARPDALARYREECGFQADGFLPLPYPQVLAAPLHLALLNRPEFPYRLLGMIHVRNHIQQERRLEEHEPLSIRVWLEGQREVRQGRELDLHTEVEADGRRVWKGLTTMLRRLPGAAERTREERPREATDEEDPSFRDSFPTTWSVAEDTGRRYARASGDYNPIHLHALSAKAFGFSRAIAHGMWTVSRCVAELGDRARAPALTLTSEFKRPLPLPSRVVFQKAPRSEAAVAYRVRGEDGTPHVRGELVTGTPNPRARKS
ncbi:MaoC family dehydratase [Archangium primigenium]|uniref:MaoC family dehydratase n=1 Tax=[Archangium] primigenium TaxID=2792470 RepID=UPI00195ED1BC|nr:MaoC/PaaZ C-terminal domain-containing protein [Archangium primigenium]MBM7115056.1 acyl dehydratase [Archangium primigenium]